MNGQNYITDRPRGIYMCRGRHWLGLKGAQMFDAHDALDMKPEDLEEVWIFDFCPGCGKQLSHRHTVMLIEIEV